MFNIIKNLLKTKSKKPKISRALDLSSQYMDMPEGLFDILEGLEALEKNVRGSNKEKVQASIIELRKYIDKSTNAYMDLTSLLVNPEYK